MVKQPPSFLIKTGTPSPLGTSRKEQGINFALFSEHATSITLCLYQPGAEAALAEIPLDPKRDRTGNIWHILIEGLPQQVEYGYRISGPNNPEKGHLFNPNHLLLDPHAKSLNTSSTWGDVKNWRSPRGRLHLDSPFDWENIRSPSIPIQDLIIYEMHVRGFTQDLSSGVKSKGTFLGLIEKIPYLKKLGVNAIELLPIHEFNETENVHKNPKTGKKLFNYWGYSTVNYFTPMARYSSESKWGAAINEFKTLVKELHRNQIEIILDVVYNHTAEGKESGPYLSFRGIDNANYYLLKPDGHYLDFTGCGNTIDSNHPCVMQMILDSLRYWVEEMHVDGFRFDLASVFCRDEKGEPLAHPPIIESIMQDPVFKKTKLIAEAWDAAGLYQVGRYPGGERWSEWNGKYRDVVRRFIKGSDGYSGPFATALSGSQDLYGNGRAPFNSINFITAHDGFSLRDLVSYQEKHNLENGEHNRDGCSNNDSWNCGHEGVTTDLKILHLREKQMRNLILALTVSMGVPMILMGDEYGHTRGGNNNPYCQDTEKNWFLWNELTKSQDLFHFFGSMIMLRRKNPLFRRTDFLKKEDVDWHGHLPFKPNWETSNRFVAYTLKDKAHNPLFYIAFNAHFEDAQVTLPPPAPNKQWKRIVDTCKIPPHDFEDLPKPVAGANYLLHAYSALLLQCI